jgi:hypothetical protein
MLSLLFSALMMVAAPPTSWSNQLPAYHAQAMPSFLGITMGEKPAAVDAVFGTPEMVKETDLGESRIYRLANGAATLMVIVHEGVIMLAGATLKSSITTSIADRYGVTLGGAARTIHDLRGTPVATLQDGAVEYKATPTDIGSTERTAEGSSTSRSPFRIPRSV